ncbi:DUF1415 domain-containing protein [Parathalassolituus penaei]|mgnify:CR=1 FL=1|uniref:DUF1415 domain-containing protein n=1 Tax=Parathalassolituus penaei TaxID=2997323 RepID=A0A9X3EEI1_9GAMM|nr:DUF1415 domain-containing protein [Parathalassolituus penaei]MCY0965730.1 DUF1415 domain-containing protein [Parathalassolituus penaei]
MKDAAWLTREWVSRLVVGEGLCPFAHPVMQQLRIEVCELEDLNRVTARFMELLGEVADADPAQLPTALFVAPNVTPDFDEYWNWAMICDELLFQMGYEGQLQVATFHPNYRFEGEAPDDASNLTNRSPFPMLHIIREADIEKALESVEFPERIPERNQRHMRRLGTDGLLALMPELADTAIFRKTLP